MKTLFFFLLGFAFFATSCKNDATTDVQPGLTGNVPGAVVGKWMYGSFAMGDFWKYDGSYAGKPFELAVVFDFKANGTYEKYFMAGSRDYSNCSTEAFTYEKGVVKFNEADGSFVCTPSEGKYRGFYSCAPNRNINRAMERSEMKVQTYYYQLSTHNSKPSIVVRFNKTDENTSTFLPTSW